MRLEEIAYPVGPDPLATYWRRRVIALVVLVLVLIWIWPSGGHKKPKDAAKSNPTSSQSPTPRTTPVGSLCNPIETGVSADADSASYKPGVSPKIVITITNNGKKTCNIDTSMRYLTISSGTDTWWSSAACPTGVQPVVSLAPGAKLQSNYLWDRKRQAKDCIKGEDAPAATYLAQAHLGGIVTPGAVIRLLPS